MCCIFADEASKQTTEESVTANPYLTIPIKKRKKTKMTRIKGTRMVTKQARRGGGEGTGCGVRNIFVGVCRKLPPAWERSR
eukprot:scaffold34676_cov176-Amphora_coffeaeformis.AAC.4